MTNRKSIDNILSIATLLIAIMLPCSIMLAQEYVPVQHKGKWGVQKDGKWTIKPQYYSIEPFGNNFVAQRREKDSNIHDYKMILSPDGTRLTPEYSNYTNRFIVIREDRAIVNHSMLIDTNGKCIYSGTRITTSSLKKDNKPLLKVVKDASYGLIDYDGNIILPPTRSNGDFYATEIPDVIKQKGKDKEIFISISSGETYECSTKGTSDLYPESYTRSEHGEISDEGNGLYKISYTNNHISGRRRIEGTKGQYIVTSPTGEVKRWTTTTDYYYYNGKFYSDEDWHEVKRPVKVDQLPNLEIVPNSIAFNDASGNNAVVGGRNSSITFKVQNTGKGEARLCKAMITTKGTKQGISTQDIDITSIAAGETKTIEIPVTADTNTMDGKVEFAIQVNEPNGYGTDPQYLTVSTRAFEAPMLQVTDYSLTGTTGSTLKKKQPFDLQLMLQNTKHGQADDVSISVTLPQNVLILDGSLQQTFPALQGGETKSLVYSLVVNQNYQSTTIPVNVHIAEKYGRYAEDRVINLTLDQTLASAKIDIEARQQQPKDEIRIASINSDVDKDIPVSPTSSTNTFAVIIGNENYQKVSRVDYALNDATMFAEYCQKTLGLPEKNIRTHKDATYATMFSAVKEIQDIANVYHGELNVIFYYAGHGFPKESLDDAYLLPVDADGRQTEFCYPLNRLYSELGSMEARSVTVFMDACFSGSDRNNQMLVSARGVAIKPKVAAPSGKMVVFSAAQGDETAYPYKEKNHGMFTYFLLKKLQETKGDVSLAELGNYIVEKVSKESIVSNGKSQTPTVTASQAVADTWRNMKLK